MPVEASNRSLGSRTSDTDGMALMSLAIVGSALTIVGSMP